MFSMCRLSFGSLLPGVLIPAIHNEPNTAQTISDTNRFFLYQQFRKPIEMPYYALFIVELFLQKTKLVCFNNIII